MFNKNKKLIEKIVDTKNKITSILFLGLTLLFPLNQQYHFRPFPSVDGFIIDYLILKISLPEIIIILLFVINMDEVLKLLQGLWRRPILMILLFLTLISVTRSKYSYLAIYENLLIFIYCVVGFVLYKRINLLRQGLFDKTIKFWIITLSLIGFFQFYFQSSVFDNYYLTGEFPYSEDYYHIKQKTLFFENFIPPYSLFSHPNIFGAYLIFLAFLLFIMKKDSLVFDVIVFCSLVLVGSAACLIAFFVFQVAKRISEALINFLIQFLIIFSLGIFFLFSFKYTDYTHDYSIYRRLYMFDLSSNYFIENPINFIFGSGYYNYFYEIRNDLYTYEIVRFFQPPHLVPLFIVWQYGILFLIGLIYLIFNYYSYLNKEFLILIVIILVLGSFDHYIVTNHQLRTLLLIGIPYSLQLRNKV